MRFHFISENGESLPIAYRLLQTGYEVAVNIWNTQNKRFGLYKNMIDVQYGIPSEAELDKDTIYIFDMTGQGDFAKKLILKGYKVIGGHDFCDRIEKNRLYGMQLAEKLGLRVPQYFTFNGMAEYREKQKIIPSGKWVLKFDDTDVVTTIIAEQNEITEVLEEMLGNKQIQENTSFIIQRYVKGVEISTEAWFSHSKILFPLNSTFEDKRLLAGNVGPNTGCAGSVIFAYQEDEPRLYRALFKTLQFFMRIMDYTGPIDINSIISEEDHHAYFLEFTPRFGYNAVYGFLDMLDIDRGYFFRMLAEGGLDRIPIKYRWNCCIHTYLLPAPLHTEIYDPATKKIINPARDVVIKLKEPKLESALWMPDIYYDGKNIVTAGSWGAVADVSGCGNTKDEAITKAYEYTKLIKIPQLCYRNDVGARISTQVVDFLNKFHYNIPI
ncbi:MAG: hypothetical protein ACP5JP_02275 [bacterium]